MKKRILICSVVFLCLFALLFGLSACALFSTNNTTNLNKNSYKVSVDTSDPALAGFADKDFKDASGNLIKPTNVPVKEGYDFAGWYTDEACTKELEFGTKLTSNITVYAKWKEKSLAVSLVNSLDESVSTIYVTYNNKAILPEKQAAGYDFTGWYTDENCTEAFDGETEIKTEITLYAGWTAKQYAIHYVTNGGQIPANAPQTYTMIAQTTLPSCTKAGYEFAGWYTRNNFSDTALNVIPAGQQGEKTFYAKYICLLAEVEPVGAAAVIEDDAITIQTDFRNKTISISEYIRFSEGATWHVFNESTEISGYITLSQNDSDEMVAHTYTISVTSEKGTVTHEYTLTINQYTADNVTVTYHFENGEENYVDPTRYAGGQAVEIDDPTPLAGYEFAYWCKGSVNGPEYDFTESLTGNLDLYAKYNIISYSITYSLGIGTNAQTNPPTYTVLEAVAFAAATPSFDEYIFEGWYSDEDYRTRVTTIDAGTIGNKKIYAAYVLKTANMPVKDFSERTEIDLAELRDYFAYVYYHRLTDVTMRITGDDHTQAEMEDYIGAANTVGRYIDGVAGKEGGYTLTTVESGVWDLRLTSTYPATPSNTSNASNYEQLESVGLVASAGRDVNFNDFAIEHIRTGLSVSSSEQLVYAAEHGYRPIPVENSVAATIYNKAKIVLRSCVDDSMTDFEKALAIYEYIINHVSYDQDIFEKYRKNEITSAQASLNYSFYLDGVFNNDLAVCDGYSKAYMLLCRMEGIPTVQVEGYGVAADNAGVNHAWNKIYLSVDGGERKWYVVDATSGDTLLTDASKEILTHAYFLIPDALMETKYREATDGRNEFSYSATSGGDYFGKTSFTYNQTEYSRKISSDAQMVAFIKELFVLTPNGTQVSMDIGLEDGYDPFVYDEDDKAIGLNNTIKLQINLLLASYELSWVSNQGFNSYVFFSKKK